MANPQELKREFDQAKHELLRALLSGGDGRDVDVQPLLDRMTRAFNELLVSTLTDFADSLQTRAEPVESDFLCAYAVNFQDGWDGADWRVMYVHGRPVENRANPPTVRDFTRQMIESGWEVVTASQCQAAASRVSVVEGMPIHELYFRRQRSRQAPHALHTAKKLILTDTNRIQSAN